MKKYLPVLIVLVFILLPVLLISKKTGAIQSGDFLYDYAGDTATITGYTGDGGHVVVPDSLDGYQVTAIGSKAFSYCSSIQNIILPDTLMLIGDFAFNNCSGLERIDIPENVILIGNDAFIGCSSLSEAIIPDSVVRIEKWAFGLCTSLLGIALPDSMDTIRENCFFGCSSLRSVVIPNGIKIIGRGAFERCTSLENIIIPGSVEQIGDYAFLGCTRLAAAYFHGPAPIIGVSVFNHCANNFSVYYLEGQDGFMDPWQGLPAKVFLAASHVVTFLDWDGTLIQNQTVTDKGAAVPPKTPSRDGYRFSGWSPSYIMVTEDLTITAQYIQEAPEITPEPAGGQEAEKTGGAGSAAQEFVRDIASSAALLAMTAIAGMFVSSVRKNGRKTKGAGIDR